MDFNRFTEKFQEAFRDAQSRAARLGHQQIDVEHLLASLLEQEGGLAPSILNKADINVPTMRRKLDQELDRLPKVSGPGAGPDHVFVTPRLQKLLTESEDEAKRLKDEYLSIEHVLLAITGDTGAAGHLFKEFGLSRQRLMEALQEVRGSQRVTNQNPETTYEALER
ncbi:MAG: Clp protease N-terminal domain-containing protein, partial [Candidatus Dormibacteraceae bacterium]